MVRCMISSTNSSPVITVFCFLTIWGVREGLGVRAGDARILTDRSLRSGPSMEFKLDSFPALVTVVFYSFVSKIYLQGKFPDGSPIELFN